MDLGLAGRVALVSGGNRGIGAATAEALAAEGARVMLTARDAAALEETAARLRADHGAEVGAVVADLTEPDGAERAVSACLAAHGRLDALVCAAGASQGGPFLDLDDSVWTDSLALKFMANVRLIRAGYARMREGGGGRIVVVIGNLAKQPEPRLLPGAAANAALAAVVTGLSREAAAEGVGIVALHPGPTRSGRWETLMANLAAREGATPEAIEARFVEKAPLGRLNECAEVGRMAAILCAPVAETMTGTSVTMDGGATLGW